MSFNQDLEISCNDLLLYSGEMTLVPHQGDSCAGVGTVTLACGAATRHLRIFFEQTDGKAASSFPASEDGRYGVGTSFMRLPHSENFFLFVTSGRNAREVVGESRSIVGERGKTCDYFELYVLNCLIPGMDMSLSFGDWLVSFQRTRCAYDLTRVSLPTHELNLTHKLIITRKDHAPFQWSHIASVLDNLFLFLSFANCSRVSAPVIYGYDGRDVGFFRFSAPRRSVPTNRRSWATELSKADLQSALSCFLQVMENDFWSNVFNRAIDWQVLADASMYDSLEQALFTTQMLLELLSFVMLVEDASILSEAGYGKLPASDRITLLCSRSNQDVLVSCSASRELKAFCAANSIGNVGELIAALRNKLTHPTKKNREYLDHVPKGIRSATIRLGLQVASLAMLKVIDYRGRYYDIIEWESRIVPWATA